MARDRAGALRGVTGRSSRRGSSKQRGGGSRGVACPCACVRWWGASTVALCHADDSSPSSRPLPMEATDVQRRVAAYRLQCLRARGGRRARGGGACGTRVLRQKKELEDRRAKDEGKLTL